MVWTKEELLRRANLWAQKQGYEPLTEASLMEWKKERLIPNPKLRGRGRGKGKAADWSYIAYYRILKIMKLREQGITHRRDQRLMLWFAGQDIPIEIIRHDLCKAWKASLKKVHYQERKALYDPLPVNKENEISPNVEQVIESIFQSSGMGESIEQLQLDQGFKSLLLGILESFFYSMINAGYTGMKDFINKLLLHIPEGIEKELLREDSSIIINTISGLASEIDSGNNFLSELENTRTISNQSLNNIRYFIYYLERIVQTLKILIPKILANKANIPLLNLSFGLFGSFIDNFIDGLRDYHFSLEDKIYIFIPILKRSEVRENNGLPFAKLGYLLNVIFTWLNRIDFSTYRNFDELIDQLNGYLLQEKTISQRIEEMKNENINKS